MRCKIFLLLFCLTGFAGIAAGAGPGMGSADRGGYGFVEISRTSMPRYDAEAVAYRHETGASVIYLANEDAEKTFGIGFKTVPPDDTGVNHIIEHCLLNGSSRAGGVNFTYLINHSAATFLNAMTFSDFTLYALAARDSEEYRGLMCTYLDDVFFPKVLSDRRIFEREGWRRGQDGINGTVYSEMKGVYSTDKAYLERAVAQALFPHTPSRFDSGGVPEAIPQLTYENFVKVYEQNYHPSQALIFLYGKQDIQETLKLLDEKYLSVLTKQDPEQKPKIVHKNAFDKNAFEKEAAFAEPARMNVSYPAREGRNTLAIGYVLGDRSDAVHASEMELFSDLLAGKADSPLNQAILSPALAENVYTEYNSMLNQCVLQIILEGVEAGKTDAAENGVYACLQQTARHGIPKEQIQALANRQAYFLASSQNQPRQGINANIEIMAGFVYGHPIGEKEYKTALKHLNQNLIQKSASALLQNQHRCVIWLSPSGAPSGNAAVATTTATAIAVRPDAENPAGAGGQSPPLQAHERLRGYTTENTLPDPPIYTQEEAEGVRMIHTKLNTHGVSSLHFYLDASALPQVLLGYAQILASTLGDYDSLPTRYAVNLGELRGYFASDNLYGSEDSFTPRAHLAIKTRDAQVKELTAAAAYLLDPDLYPDKAAVKSYLLKTKSAMENEYETHMPWTDCLARISAAGRFDYEISGPAYFAFVQDLLQDFDQRWPSIAENIISAKKTIWSQNNAVISFTGSDRSYQIFRKNAAPVLSRLTAVKPAQQRVSQNYDFPALEKHPHYESRLSQTYAILQGGSFQKAGRPYNGAFLVTASLINYDYLWPKIRDEGGAYGVNVMVTPGGAVLLRSCRDPNLSSTLSAYQGIPDFLKTFLSSAESAGYEGVRRHVLAEWDEQWQPYRLWDYGAKVELGLIDPEAIRQTRFEIQNARPSEAECDQYIWERILAQDIIATGGKKR
ncbi:MAG: insulinase family protein [Clostridiales bacterium]|jgi:Zn-dependent M16 (insulinase) family peptidase|nr:insulinase family protein [Clostridiales bacterium]